MYLRYTLFVRYGNEYIFEKSFKSLNQIIKVAVGFNYDDPSVSMYITDDLTDHVISFSYIKKMIKEFI